MSDKRVLFIAAVLTGVFMSAFLGDTANAKPGFPEELIVHHLASLPTREELDKTLRKGMKKDEVLEIFGAPTRKENSCFSYELPPITLQKNRDSNPDGDKLITYDSGFQICFEDGKVMSWRVLQTTTAKEAPPKEFSEREAEEHLKSLDKLVIKKTYTEQQIDNLLREGMTEAEVEKIFGAPFLSQNFTLDSTNWISLQYKFDTRLISQENMNTHVALLAVLLKEGRVACWEAHYCKDPKFLKKSLFSRILNAVSWGVDDMTGKLLNTEGLLKKVLAALGAGLALAAILTLKMRGGRFEKSPGESSGQGRDDGKALK